MMMIMTNKTMKRINTKTIIKANRTRCLNSYDALECKNVGDYHKTYLLCDALLLAHVFDNFRKTCISYYKLDPANYVATPYLAWGVMLLKAKVGAVA